MSDAVVIPGNNIDVLKTFPDNSVDSIVTDPPYGLSFMGKKWDYDVPTKELWTEVLRVLKPGGHLLSFGGTRTYHRLVIAIEDAGFEIRDQIQWIYGSGFPKSMNVGKQVDTHKGFGTALKPANEPIVLARKPLSESTVAKNVLKHGTGALNIDGTRIEAADQDKLAKNWDREKLTDMRGGNYGNGKAQGVENKIQAPQGRWPANVLFDEEAAAMLDEQSGMCGAAGKDGKRTAKSYGQASKNSIQWIDDAGHAPFNYGDSGGASRFFYVAKASKRERNAGLEGMPEISKSHLASPDGGGGGWSKDSDKNPNLPRANHHPTVKPIKLMEYLVTLITPPGGTILDPFCGSGSTGVAAVNLGFDFIGIELEPDYCKIAEKRIENANDDKTSNKTEVG